MARLIRPIRRLSPQCCNIRQLFSKRQTQPPSSSIPNLLLFPSFSTARSPTRLRPPKALIPTLIAEKDDGDSDAAEFDASRSSRNQRKREARRAVQWGMDLVSFSKYEVKRILRAASLGEDVYDALMLAKKIGNDAREGKRRHFNYIGKLLRGVEPVLMDTLIYATKHGDETKLQALITSVKDSTDDVGDSIVDDDTETESEDDLESSEEYMAMAARWFDGLISQNVQLTKEVYSLQSIDFDRQELRKLVRKVQLIHEERKGITEEKQKEVDAALVTAEKSLNLFLRSMAKQMQTDLYL